MFYQLFDRFFCLIMKLNLNKTTKLSIDINIINLKIGDIMAKIGYARVSSKNQNLDRQIESLQGVSKLFSDKISGQSLERTQLKAMLEYIREGDIVIVTELDRLGRNNKDLTDIMNQIQQKGATLEVLNLPSMSGIEDENLRRLINNLVIELYKYQAESERKRIRERQQQGIELAKEKGKFKGGQLKYQKTTQNYNMLLSCI